ncbi:phosphatase 2C-like domain-containing protein [Mycena galericulata]|nr:phosphatase 2C-like domain-containing protein [Mycena galericulata]
MLWLRAHRHLNLSASARYSTSQERPYTFHLAAEWAGKPPWKDMPKPKASFPPTSPIVRWSHKSRTISRFPGKPRSAGEDFFLCTSMQNNSGVALGVADGVGGWIDQGIDCSMFSQALMYYAHGHFANGWAGEPEIDPTVEAHTNSTPEGVEMTPSECLQLAYHDVLADESIEVGSSTACLLTLNASSGILRSANLGDSGLCIIRSSSMFYISSPQTHYFNCPRQLAKLHRVRGRSLNNQDSIQDFPSAAETYSTRLMDGDIVIAFTDGLADNIYTRESACLYFYHVSDDSRQPEILKICSLVMKGSGSEAAQIQSIAQHLVNYSRSCMFSDRVSPFQLEAKQHKKWHQGGNIVYSVTVVAALVRETL